MHNIELKSGIVINMDQVAWIDSGTRRISPELDVLGVMEVAVSLHLSDGSQHTVTVDDFPEVGRAISVDRGAIDDRGPLSNKMFRYHDYVQKARKKGLAL